MKKEKKPLVINPFVLIFCVVFICGLLTFVITPGTWLTEFTQNFPKPAEL